jgi:protein-S-isoprenylcysteine O-methyltransferase Ste14
MMPSSFHKLLHRKASFAYVALILGLILLGWNAAQFKIHSNYILVFIVNEALGCLCLVSICLFFRRATVKNGKNESNNK